MLARRTIRRRRRTGSKSELCRRAHRTTPDHRLGSRRGAAAPGGTTPVVIHRCDEADRPDGIALSNQALPLHPHNAVLQVWLELGGVGVALGFGPLIFAIWHAFRNPAWRTRPVQAMIAATAAAAVSIGLISFGIWQEWFLSGLFHRRCLRRSCRRASLPAVHGTISSGWECGRFDRSQRAARLSRSHRPALGGSFPAPAVCRLSPPGADLDRLPDGCWSGRFGGRTDHAGATRRRRRARPARVQAVRPHSSRSRISRRCSRG